MPELTQEETDAVELALNTEIDGEADLMKALERKARDGKLSQADRNRLKGALRLLGGSEALADVLKAATETGGGDAKPKPEPEPKVEPKEEPKGEPKEETEVTKALRADVTKLTGENVELKKWQAEMIEKAETAAVRQIVAEMNVGSMSTEDQIKFVGKLDSEGREMLKAWANGLRASSEAPTAVGSPRRAEPHADSAQAEIMKRANERVQKDTTGKTTIADAITRVIEEDPELAARTRDEYPMSATRQGG